MLHLAPPAHCVKACYTLHHQLIVWRWVHCVFHTVLLWHLDSCHVVCWGCLNEARALVLTDICHVAACTVMGKSQSSQHQCVCSTVWGILCLRRPGKWSLIGCSLFPQCSLQKHCCLKGGSHSIMPLDLCMAIICFLWSFKLSRDAFLNKKALE